MIRQQNLGLSYTRRHDRSYVGYIQFYRNAVVEAVDTRYVGPREFKNPFAEVFGDGSQKVIKGIKALELEPVLIKMLWQLLDFYREVSVTAPVYLFVTLTGVRGGTLIGKGDVDHQLGLDVHDYLINDDIVPLPEVQIDAFDLSADRILRPAFDALWQAAGRSHCPNYDAEGNRSK